MEGIWLVAFLAQWALLLFLGLLVIGVLRKLSLLQQRWNMAAPPITSLEVGEALPELRLPDRSGSPVEVNAYLKGRGGAVVFLSGTCASCRAVLEQLGALDNRDVVNRGLVLIMVGDAAEARRSLEAHSLTLPFLLVVFDVEGSTMRRLSVLAVPTGLIVDERCRLVSQTFNPHAGHWIHRALHIPPPTRETRADVGLVVPMTYAALSEAHPTTVKGGDRM
jgi:hypothetical protein